MDCILHIATCTLKHNLLLYLQWGVHSSCNITFLLYLKYSKYVLININNIHVKRLRNCSICLVFQNSIIIMILTVV